MELTIATGRGYAPAERHSSELPVGTIAIDALFSPVRKVNFTVTNARVGQQTDYDKLTLECWTNGSVRPDDGVAYAAKILKEQLNLFINFEEMAEPVEVCVAGERAGAVDDRRAVAEDAAQRGHVVDGGGEHGRVGARPLGDRAQLLLVAPGDDVVQAAAHELGDDERAGVAARPVDRDGAGLGHLSRRAGGSRTRACAARMTSVVMSCASSRSPVRTARS